MEEIKFDDFYSVYGVKRNPVQSSSLYDNTMLDFDEEELEVIEETPMSNVWTLTERKEGLSLMPGIEYGKGVMGFFICKEKWDKNQKGFILK